MIGGVPTQPLARGQALSVLLRDNGEAKAIDLCSAHLMVFADGGDTQKLHT